MPTDTGPSGTTPPPPPSAGPHTRRLVRYPHHGPLGGVCAGVGHYLGVDPTIVRIAAVILAITGPGIPAYALAWIFVPAEDGSMVASWPGSTHRGERTDRTAQILGIGAIAIAVSVLWGDWWRPAHGWFVPVGLIAFGAWLLLRNRDEDELAPPPGPAGPQPWQPTPPTTPFSVTPAPFPPAGVTEPTDPTGSTPMDPSSPTTDTDAGASGDTTLVDDPDQPPADGDPTTTVLPGTMTWGPTPPGSGPDTGWATFNDPPPPAPGRRPRRRRVLGPVVFGALLLWGGIAWLTGVGAENGLAVGLCLVGAGFVIGAFVGGSKVLILPALVITAALIVVSTVDIPIASGIGDRTWRVASAADLEHSYKLGIGDATLDLRDLPLTAGDRVSIDVKVGIGHLVVYVPEGATVEASTDIGAGDSELFGHEESGSSVKDDRTVKGTADGGHITLDLHLGLGRVEVHRAEPTAVSDSVDPSSTTTTPPTPTTPPVPVGA